MIAKTRVAPYTGVWIETPVHDGADGDRHGRALYGRVD